MSELTHTSPLADRLREARITANLSQAELAERLECSERTVQHWEAGTIPRPAARRRIFEFIDFVDGRIPA